MRYPLTWWLPEGVDFGDTAYAAAKRCGSGSVHKYFNNMEYAQIAVDVSDHKRVVFVREPIERLRSSYARLYREGLVRTRWPEFVDAVLAGTLDYEHIATQAEVYTDATEYVKLENIAKVLPFIGTENHYETVRRYRPTHRLDEIKEHYAEDIELWKSL